MYKHKQTEKMNTKSKILIQAHKTLFCLSVEMYCRPQKTEQYEPLLQYRYVMHKNKNALHHMQFYLQKSMQLKN